jgi:lipid-A-disaccharide synthase
VLALLPGSRLGEIRRLGRDFLDAAALLKRSIPALHIVVPMANAACRDAFANLLGAGSPIASTEVRILDGRAHEAMIAADAVLLASGTAALEAMLAKRPMAVAYRLAPLTHWIVKTFGLLRTASYALPNVLAGRQIVPELMQDACTPSALAAALLPALRTRTTPPDLLADYRRLHDTLHGADAAAAAAIAELLGADAKPPGRPV